VRTRVFRHQDRIQRQLRPVLLSEFDLYANQRGWSFARSTRIGILQPYRNTVSLNFPAPTTPPLPEVIPLPERFFAGGGTSLRGIALNQAGPAMRTQAFRLGARRS